jgi:hypothetical protein
LNFFSSSKSNRASHDPHLEFCHSGVLPALSSVRLWRWIILLCKLLDRKFVSRAVLFIEGEGIRMSMMGDRSMSVVDFIFGYTEQEEGVGGWRIPYMSCQ